MPPTSDYWGVHCLSGSAATIQVIFGSHIHLDPVEPPTWREFRGKSKLWMQTSPLTGFPTVISVSYVWHGARGELSFQNFLLFFRIKRQTCVASIKRLHVNFLPKLLHSERIKKTGWRAGLAAIAPQWDPYFWWLFETIIKIKWVKIALSVRVGNPIIYDKLHYTDHTHKAHTAFQQSFPCINLDCPFILHLQSFVIWSVFTGQAELFIIFLK